MVQVRAAAMAQGKAMEAVIQADMATAMVAEADLETARALVTDQDMVMVWALGMVAATLVAVGSGSDAYETKNDTRRIKVKTSLPLRRLRRWLWKRFWIWLWS